MAMRLCMPASLSASLSLSRPLFVARVLTMRTTQTGLTDGNQADYSKLNGSWFLSLIEVDPADDPKIFSTSKSD